MGKAEDGVLAKTLRAKGFVPLPRLWVKNSDIPKIHAIADGYLDEIKQTREELNQDTHSDAARIQNEIELAWAMLERRAG